MATCNVDTFLRAADATNRGDADALVAVTHPEAVAEPIRAATEGAYVGHDGVRRFIADTAATFEFFRADYPDVRELEDGRVLAIGTASVRGRGSGVEATVASAVVTEYRDGLMWRFKDYGDEVLARQHL
jgi:ketosteroid isomerase-like protein